MKLCPMETEEVTQPEKNPFEHDRAMREYDVEFYMKCGLNQKEAIEYILNKLKVKQLWSKMSKNTFTNHVYANTNPK